MAEMRVCLKSFMPGIYLHIPFCKQACHYCDFHFSTNARIKGELLQAMAGEILLQKDYLLGETVETVYFGGGTPSLLDAPELNFLLQTIIQTHTVSPDAEITLEANPDDLTPTKLRELRVIGVNRLSIGIQSFDEPILRYLNRSHSSETAIQCVGMAREAGFGNFSLDLIYAIPGLTEDAWKRNIEQTLRLNPPHISAYTLTIEEKTVFGNWLAKGKLKPVDETSAAEQLEILMEVLSSGGYRQYEISNFAFPGFESRHNSSYWKGKKYLGIGPSAHSYNQRSRQHNIANNHLYVQSLKEKKIPSETDVLSRSDLINEYILTSLRTDEGCDLAVLKGQFNYDLLTLFGKYLRELENHYLVSLQNGHLTLTQDGRLLADRISSDLFLIGQ